MSKEHTYSNGEVTIVWKKELCIHSTKCWRGLHSVFQPGERPWIKPEGADTEAIKAQIDQCPSGALSYRMERADEAPGAVEAEELRIEVSPHGPLLVKAACRIVHSDGRIEERNGPFALCRCGHSSRKPFCDGSHKQTGFSDPEP